MRSHVHPEQRPWEQPRYVLLAVQLCVEGRPLQATGLRVDVQRLNARAHSATWDQIPGSCDPHPHRYSCRRCQHVATAAIRHAARGTADVQWGLRHDHDAWGAEARPLHAGRHRPELFQQLLRDSHVKTSPQCVYQTVELVGDHLLPQIRHPGIARSVWIVNQGHRPKCAHG
jgi:hypothetical protein